MHIPIVILKRFVLCCGLFFASVPGGYAQTDSTAATQGDPLMLYFRIGQVSVERSYLDNRHTLRRLDDILSDSVSCSRIDSLHIYSFASPDGRLALNLQLAAQRSATVGKYLLRSYPHLSPRRIRTLPQGENWKQLRQLISLDDSLPARSEVLRIIDHTPDNEQCKQLLGKLNGGQPYRYIARRILPLLRNAAVCVAYLREPLPPIDAKTAEVAALIHATPCEPLLSWQPTTHTLRRPLLAVKTNLLFDLAMAPNIEIELPLGTRNRWSVNAEWMFPWWLFEGDKYCFQVLSGGLEGRYWLGNRSRQRVLTGHFVGFYAGAGKYDLQWDKDGYQGEFYIASGISYGYTRPIARNLSLELSIGIGLMKTSYEHYHTLDNYQTLLWQNNGRYTWLGPTKAKISFVWLLNRKVKVTEKGGAQ